MQAAILPMLFVLFRDKLSQMKIGRMEALLAVYVVVRVFCDFLSRGYSDAQNYAFYMLSALIGPYLLGRYVISNRRMDIETARMFVLMFLLFFPMFVYEIKAWVSPIFKLFSPFFPNAGSGLSIRWGLARTAGTFEHPILACIMIIAVYRLHRWLCWLGVWDQPQSGLLGFIQRLGKWLPITFKYQISIALILMALMTISRGPWIGGFAGAALAAVGNFKNRKLWLIIVVSGFLTGVVVGQLALDAYITPKEGEVLSGEAQTMLYRKVMIDQYKAFLMDKVWTGWGLTTVPEIKGMESVDNAFFLMALQHGVIASGLFITILLYAIISQIKFGLRAPAGQPPIGFTFAGVYLMCFISFATVYMGAQTEPMIFLLLGWGESIKNRREVLEPSTGTVSGPSAPALPFRRVIY
ncbi:MAG: hypothetical protein P9E88_04465 [Candidatus Competibacter sp.]|nr:hypothetical protein [Candidatus Competibacter sp.]